MGLFLLVAALMASIEGRLRFAESPVAGDVGAGAASSSGRGDALVSRRLAPVRDRRSFNAPFTRMVNGQEVIHTARFTQFAARLSAVGADADEPVPDGVLEAALRPPGRPAQPDDGAPNADPGDEADVLVTRRPLDPETLVDAFPTAGQGPVLSAARAAEEVRAI